MTTSGFLDFFFERQSGSCRQKRCKPHQRCMASMTDAKSFVYIQGCQRGQQLGEFLVIVVLAWIKSQILQKHCISRLHGLDQAPYVIGRFFQIVFKKIYVRNGIFRKPVCFFVDHCQFPSPEMGKPFSDRLKAQFIIPTFWPAEMRADNYFCLVLREILERRHDCFDPRIVQNRAFFNGNIKLGPDQDRFICHIKFSHRPQVHCCLPLKPKSFNNFF